jgi:hypothetical protein
METNSSSVFYLGAIALLAQSEKVTSLSVTGSLEDIQLAVKLFGATVYVSLESNQIFSHSKIGKTTLWFHHHTNALSAILQKESFQSNESIFEKETDLSIIDNQYLVLNTK